MRKTLEELFGYGVEAVRGFKATQSTLEKLNIEQPDTIIAIGKAAGDMALGARDFFDIPINTLVATKYDHVSDELIALDACHIFEAAHPIPDENSLIAGAHILDTVKAMDDNSKLLLLVSGGASSLIDVLRPSISLDDLMAQNKRFMADGLSIGAINKERKKLSHIKAGQLLDHFGGKTAQVIAISDVEGDSIDVIGSGIGAYHGPGDHIKITIAASNKVARDAIVENTGLPIIFNEECLYDRAESVSETIFEKLDNGPTGLYLFGGEPTVHLPANPGRGGRNQHLALLLAAKIRNRNDLTILVAGTDGTDGPTADAGAIIDGETIPAAEDISAYLANADAGTFLAKRNALLTTGPTGTNVMDLVIAIKT